MNRKYLPLISIPIILIIVIVFLTGCIKTVKIPTNALKDGGLLTNDPCGPPCFYQITPGITTQNNAMKIIQKSPEMFIDCVSTDMLPSNNKSIVSCAYFDISFQNQVVKSLDYYPSSKITSQQLIDSYGIPDSISVRLSSLLPDEPFRVVMQFCYDQIRTTLLFSEQKGRVYKIDSKTPIQFIAYDDNESYDPLCGSKNSAVTWVGYGEYNATVP